jgi:CheY-like chemotaxis protein
MLMLNFRTALVVDDDPVSRFLLKMLLRKAIRTTKIVESADGQHALNYLVAHCLDAQAAHEECPDLILLNLDMPVMDGFEFLSHLDRKQQTSPLHVRVVIITSSANQSNIEQAYQYNIRGYLLKPVTEASLSGVLIH